MSAPSASGKRQIPGLAQTLHDGIERMKSVIRSDPFTFVINGSRFETDVMTAVLLSPAVHSELQRDRSFDRFEIDDSSVSVEALRVLKDFVSGSSVTLSLSDRKSLLSVCRSLQNGRLEMVVFACWIGESSPSCHDIFVGEDRILGIDPREVYDYFDSDLSLLSVESLFELFSSDS
jgi:hypothetical protein